MPAVFLSHNSRDKPLVRPLCRWLSEQLGSHEVFFDENSIGSGDVIPQRLERAIAECSCALVCFGPKGEGRWQEQEIWALLGKAIDRSHHAKGGEDFRLIPVLLEGADPDEIPYLYRTRLWADFRQGITDQEAALCRLLAAIKGERGGAGGRCLRPEDNPFLGLEPFTETVDEQGRGHHLYFFGRDQQVRDLAVRMAREKLVLISGASGNGKSSLARAGLRTPAADEGVKGVSSWRRLCFTPGHDFFFSFCNALLPKAASNRGSEVQSISEAFSGDAPADEDVLRRPRLWARRFFEILCTHFIDRESDRVLIIVDQFEEIFTQQVVSEKMAKGQWVADVLAMLHLLATEPAFRQDPRFHFVLTLRSEFRVRCRISNSFWSYIDEVYANKEKPRHLMLDELTDDQWRQAVKGPAERAGAYFEPGLVGVVLKDVCRQRGSMPLLQHALQQLWLKADGACLNLKAYETSGGVSGALALSADRALRDVSGKSALHEEVCRSLFLRLISFGEGVPDTRRRVHVGELDFGPAMQPALDEILMELQRKECRLLSRDGDEIEVTHEALIRECKQVVDWMEDTRRHHDLQLFRQLSEAAQAWVREGRRSRDLWPKHRLRRFHVTVMGSKPDLP